jgi:hypothetical protein
MRVNRSSTALVVAALWILGCSPEPLPEDEEPPSSGAPIYKYRPTYCHGDCWSLTLSRSDTFIELRAHQPNGTFLGLATGILSDPASDELDQLLDTPIDLGELSGIWSFDAPVIELWLPGLHLIYDVSYPPSGLVELDAFLWKVLDDMSQCHPTTQITPDHDCEPLAYYPE